MYTFISQLQPTIPLHLHLEKEGNHLCGFRISDSLKIRCSVFDNDGLLYYSLPSLLQNSYVYLSSTQVLKTNKPKGLGYDAYAICIPFNIVVTFKFDT